MAVFRSILKIPLGDHDLNVVKEDRKPGVLLSVVPTERAGVQYRITVAINDSAAQSLMKFLAGMRDDHTHTVRVERETTSPAVPPTFDGEDDTGR